MPVTKPYVSVFTYDDSAVSPNISTDINIAMPINAQTGPDKYLCRSVAELINVSMTDNTIGADADTTIKHAAKILQFSPVWLSRASNNKVLSGVTDKGSIVYTNRNFNYYNYKLDTAISVSELKYPVIYQLIDNGKGNKYLLYSGCYLDINKDLLDDSSTTPVDITTSIAESYDNKKQYYKGDIVSKTDKSFWTELNEDPTSPYNSTTEYAPNSYVRFVPPGEDKEFYYKCIKSCKGVAPWVVSDDKEEFNSEYWEAVEQPTPEWDVNTPYAKGSIVCTQDPISSEFTYWKANFENIGRDPEDDPHDNAVRVKYYKVVGYFLGKNSVVGTEPDVTDDWKSVWEDVTKSLMTPETILKYFNRIVSENTLNNVQYLYNINISDSYSYILGNDTNVLKDSIKSSESISTFNSLNTKTQFKKINFKELKMSEDLNLSDGGYYISINGATYINPGIDEITENSVYPGEPVGVYFYDTSRKISLQDFFICMTDYAMGSQDLAKPYINESIFTLQINNPNPNSNNYSIEDIKTFGDDDNLLLDIDKNIDSWSITNFPNTNKLGNYGLKFTLDINGTDKFVYFHIGDIVNYNSIFTPDELKNTDNLFIKCKLKSINDLVKDISTIQAMLYFIGNCFKDTSSILYAVSSGIGGILDSNTPFSFTLKPAEAKDSDSCNLLFKKSELISFSYNLPPGSIDQTTVNDQEVWDYSISNYSINSLSRSLSNVYIEVREYNSTGDIANDYVLYVGNFDLNLLGKSVIRLSTDQLSPEEFIDKARRIIDQKYDIIWNQDGFSIMSRSIPQFEFDWGICSSEGIKSTSSLEDSDLVIDTSFEDLTPALNNACFAVIPRYCSNKAIFKFTCEQDSVDGELYNFTIYKKDETNSTNYTISFVPNKVDGYGRMVYLTWVNELNEDIYLSYIGTSSPMKLVESDWFGNTIPSLAPQSDDYVSALDRFLVKDGTYYDFIFNGGIENSSVDNKCYQVGRDIYAHALMSIPQNLDNGSLGTSSIDDIDSQISFRQGLGINWYNSKIMSPYSIDTTVGDFVSYISPCVSYMERVILNQKLGKEFAPNFWFTNGTVNANPLIKYVDTKNEIDPLLNAQICPILYDRVRGICYPALDLTAQTIDSQLSDSNNVRMINACAHVCDQLMEQFIGEFNDESTRERVRESLKLGVNQRFNTSPKYKPTEIKIVCDETNNPISIIEQRYLIVDVYFKFTPGIRYVHVYQRVVKLSADLSNVGAY